MNVTCAAISARVAKKENTPAVKEHSTKKWNENEEEEEEREEEKVQKNRG